MPRDDSVELTREELYDLVWKEPMVKLAPKYGLSDVGLAKICRKYDIPRPPVGYWAKLAFGKPVKRPPLPDLDEADKIEIRKFRDAFFGKQSDAPKKDLPPEIVVAERLTNPHPLVRKAKDVLLACKPNERGLVYCGGQDGLDVSVTPKSVPRALRILDALIKYWESNVGVIEQGTRFWIGEDNAQVKVVEIVRRFEKEPGKRQYWKEWSYEPTQRLSMEVESWNYGLRRKWADGKRQRLENVLGRVVVSLNKWIAHEKQDRLDRECTERQEGKAKERRQLAKEKRKTEKLRREQLMELVSNWETAERVRRYLAAVEEGIADGRLEASDPDSFADWLEWARWYADDLCPISRSTPRTEAAEVPDCQLFAELDLTSETKKVLIESTATDTDMLYAMTRDQIRELAGQRDWTVWREVNRVLEGLGYDVSARANW